MALSDAEQHQLLDKLRKVDVELTYGFQSRVADSDYRDTLAGYALNSDAADYRAEQRLAALELKIDKLSTVSEPIVGLLARTRADEGPADDGGAE
ncbi:hypothetical protein [Nocardia lijiangensis]|uniref:hypothetical protein n=1 Tax=Nocardia lijiangensis TaxID=299618 RepID=UPI003D727D3A